VKGLRSSGHRGYDRAPGGGVNGAPIASEPFKLDDVLDSRIWTNMAFFMNDEMQTTMFQPVGGMGMIGKAFAKQVEPMLTYNAKVTKIRQDKKGVTVTMPTPRKGNAKTAHADYVVCTIPLAILNQIDVNVSPQMREAIGAVPYSGQVKMGLEMRRRFWEEDAAIYGGHSFTSQDIALISYPNYNFFKDGPAVLLGAFANGLGAYRLAA
jgi:monoamine oxidase